MAINPATLKVISKVATDVATDEKARQVILIACLVPFILILLVMASPFAIFFAITGNGSMDSTSVSSALGDLQNQLSQKILQEEQDPNTDECKTYVMGSEDNQRIDNSMDVLMVYSAKYNVLDKDAEQVAVLTVAQINKLISVFWDMNQVTSKVESVPEVVTVTTIDSKGKVKTETKTITKNIKSIYVDAKTAEEMIEVYGFKKKQIAVMAEMKKESYGLELVHFGASQPSLTVEQIQAIKNALPEGTTLDRSKLVEAALSLVGKVHYFWGGKSFTVGMDKRWGTETEVTAEGSSTTGAIRPYGLDCSGYVAWCFINAGIPVEAIGTGTATQWQTSTNMTIESVDVGDLAFLAIPGTRKINHIGIVVGKNSKDSILVAHCNASDNNVVVTTAEEAGFRYYRRPAVFVE